MQTTRELSEDRAPSRQLEGYITDPESSPEGIMLEIERLETLTAHLERSNTEIQEYLREQHAEWKQTHNEAEEVYKMDVELLDAVAENQRIIEKYQQRIIDLKLKQHPHIAQEGLIL